MFRWLFSAFSWLFAGIRFLSTGFKSWLVLLVLYFFRFFVPKVLASLGVGVVTYNLGSYGLDSLYDLITSQFGGLPADFLTILKLARIDDFLSIVFGAYTARLTLQGLSSGNAVTRWLFGGIGGLLD